MRMFFAAAAAFLAAGCAQKDDIAVYRVPKEEHRSAAAEASPAAAVAWDVPDGWRKLPASGMRVASFGTAAGGEVSVVALPREAGGDLANMNRWRGQLGLAPIDARGLAGQSRALASRAGELLVVDFASPAKGRMVGARLLSGGQTWFFKLTGTAAAVAAAQPVFEKFLSGLRLASTPASAALPEIALAAAQDDTAPSRGLRWTAPRGWKEQTGTGLRLATYTVPGQDGKSAEVSVVALPGDAGGDLANVNRWRGQLGLGEIDESGLKQQARRLNSPAGDVLVVDLNNPGKGRMVAARLFAGGQSWFFKMTGEERVVASAKTGFEGFLGSLRNEAQ